MSDDTATPQIRESQDYAMIDHADCVDVASFDSFPASDPPAWIATDIASTRPYLKLERDAERLPGASGW